MKKTILILAAGAMALAGTMASAQSRDGRDGRDGRDNRTAPATRGSSQFRAGDRLDDRFRTSDRIISDFGRYRLGPPPRGYAYYRTDTGDFVLAAIATGLISSVIAQDINGGYGGPAYSYGPPAYGPPGYDDYYGAPYGGPPVYYDRYGRPYTVDQYGRSVWLR